MDKTAGKIIRLLDEVLHLNGGSADWNIDTPLLGAVPQLDSMAVVRVVSEIERVFGFHFEDDEINADLFASVRTLSAFVHGKLPPA